MVSSYSRLQTQLVGKRCLLMCGIHGGMYRSAPALAYIGTSCAGFLTSALCDALFTDTEWNVTTVASTRGLIDL
jgi:hypothetical protein